MKTRTLRIAIPLALLALAAIGFAAGSSIGTLSAFGWGDVSLLCPLGALSTMLAGKLVIPRAVVSLVIALVLILLVGRAFCAWVCPIPAVSRLREAFTKKGNRKKEASDNEAKTTTGGNSQIDACNAAAPLSKDEQALLRTCNGDAQSSCRTCAEKRLAVDSRHFFLGGALASAAIFGFPVFCLVCPIGLTFATIFLTMRLFGGGDMTWAVVVVPVLLLVEVVFFRKWCASFCPLSALMSLVAKANRTFKPVINERACLETAKGASCGRCAQACPEGIDVRHPERGASWSECTRCRECVDACPAHAISLPLVHKRWSDNKALPMKEDGSLRAARPQSTEPEAEIEQ